MRTLPWKGVDALRALVVVCTLLAMSACGNQDDGLRERLGSCQSDRDVAIAKSQRLETERSELLGKYNSAVRDAQEATVSTQACNSLLSDVRGKVFALETQSAELEKRAGFWHALLAAGTPTGKSVQSWASTLVVALLVVLAQVTLFLYLVQQVFETSAPWSERYLRGLAFLLAVLAYFGARKIGLSVPQLIFDALKVAGPLGFLPMSALAAIFSLPAGYFVAWYLQRSFHTSAEVTKRIGILFGALVLLIQGDLFVEDVTSPQANGALSANLAFVLGMGLYMILKVKPQREAA